MATKAIRNKVHKAEQAAARKRAAGELERLQNAVESISDDDLAGWWFGMQQHADRALEGDFEIFEEPARSGVKAWFESGAIEAMKSNSAEYDVGGPLPKTESPGSDAVIPEWRVNQLREKTSRLARIYGHPVQRDPNHPAHPANASA